MKIDAGVYIEPLADDRMLVGPAVLQDDVQVPSWVNSRQIIATVKLDTPTSSASKRVDQWVTPNRFGGPASVRATISNRMSSLTSRGRPDRGQSISPSMPASA